MDGGEYSTVDVVDVAGDGGALLWPMSSTCTDAVCSVAAAVAADDSINSSLRNCHRWMCCDDDDVVGVVTVATAVLVMVVAATAVFPVRAAVHDSIGAVVELAGWSESES